MDKKVSKSMQQNQRYCILYFTLFPCHILAPTLSTLQPPTDKSVFCTPQDPLNICGCAKLVELYPLKVLGSYPAVVPDMSSDNFSKYNSCMQETKSNL